MAYYSRTLQFELLQEISGVIAIVRKGSLHLQLWQSGEGAPRNCTINWDGAQAYFRSMQIWPKWQKAPWLRTGLAYGLGVLGSS